MIFLSIEKNQKIQQVRLYLQVLQTSFIIINLENQNIENYQGNAVVNYTEYEVPYTRIIEHKHFEYDVDTTKTVVTKEYPDKWVQGKEPYYTINDERNNNLYQKYSELAKSDKNVIFGGRLGQYKYFDMDKVIAEALNCVKAEL